MTSPESGEVLDHLHALMFHFKVHMHQAVRDDAAGLAPMEARALAFFARKPGSTQSDLVQHAMRDKAQVARLVKLLVDRGLLKTEADPEDRRLQRLYLTEAGRAVQRKMQQHRRRFEGLLLAALSDEECLQLRDLLARARSGLERE